SAVRAIEASPCGRLETIPSRKFVRPRGRFGIIPSPRNAGEGRGWGPRLDSCLPIDAVSDASVASRLMSYTADRRQEEKDRRRAEIIDAAQDLYRELGWDAVTMDGVAKRARLSRALIYVYFKDKRDLHFAITVRALDVLRQRFE